MSQKKRYWNPVFAVGVVAGMLYTPAILSAEPSSGSLSERRAAVRQASDVEREVQQEVAQRAAFRAQLPAYFAEAYRTYPSIPEGVLEALAFVGSRWIHRVPESAFDGHMGMPQTYGVMGLYRGQAGFGNQVGLAARALGVAEAEVIHSPRTNVLAAAALLDRLIRDAGLERPFVEELVGVLGRFSGLPGDGRIGQFARDSFAFDVLLTLDRGHDDHGIRIRDREIFWEQAFDAQTLKRMRAPMVRIGLESDSVEALGSVEAVGMGDSMAQKSAEKSGTSATVDYPPALWVSSPNYSSRSGAAITHAAIHTVQGSYSGCISWFQNPDSNVSAHYVARSSDGQITQMVREYNKAWHIGSENPYTLGTEHEGYVDTSSYYTTAMYNSSAALTKDMCSSNKFDCSTTYGGASSSSVQVLSSSYHVKGHQHYPNQTHTDPGKYWDWAKFKSLVTGSTSGGSSGGSTGGSSGGSTSVTTVLDNFESSEGHFNTSPTYSGSTKGISTSSTAERTSSMAKTGSYSERLKLLDDSASSSSWVVRFLSGSGSASSNTKVDKAGGRIGFWVYTGGSDVSASILVDDGSGTEESTRVTLPVNTWKYLEWKLDDAAQWNSFYSGNGTIDSSQVTVDALMFYRAQTSYTVYVYVDDVTYKK